MTAATSREMIEETLVTMVTLVGMGGYILVMLLLTGGHVGPFQLLALMNLYSTYRSVTEYIWW